MAKGGTGRPPRSGDVSEKVLGIRFTSAELAELKRRAGDVPVSMWARSVLLGKQGASSSVDDRLRAIERELRELRYLAGPGTTWGQVHAFLRALIAGGRDAAEVHKWVDDAAKAVERGPGKAGLLDRPEPAGRRPRRSYRGTPS